MFKEHIEELLHFESVIKIGAALTFVLQCGSGPLIFPSSFSPLDVIVHLVSPQIFPGFILQLSAGCQLSCFGFSENRLFFSFLPVAGSLHAELVLEASMCLLCMCYE